MGRIESALLVGDRSAPPHYGQSDSIIKLVDLSLHPSKNDRAAKLGNFWGTPGGAVCDYDPKTNKVSIADGLMTPGSQRSVSPFEPDMWLYRIHSEVGLDRVWAGRGIADHTNKHNELKCRSTYVVDQQDIQRQGHYSEVFWVKDVGVKIADALLKLGPAGQTAAICQQRRGGFRAPTPTGGQGNPDDQRYHLCFNVNNEAGFITDGGRIGQFRRVIVLDPWLKSGSNADGEPLVHAAIPSDVVFSANPSQWGPLAFDCGGFPVTNGEILTGYHWWNTPTSQCRVNKDHTDKSEDGKQISPLDAPKNIWVFVKKANEWVPTGDGKHLATAPAGPQVGFPAPLGGAAGPAAGGAGAFATTDYIAGVLHAESGVIPLPEQIPVGWGMCAQFEFITPGLGGILPPSIHAQFDYCVVPRGGNAAPLVVTGTFTRILTPVLYPGPNFLYRIIFKVPYLHIKNAAGGKIAWAFARRGDIDTSPSTLHIAGREFSFGAALQAV